jgi:uncharacterized protein YndB with AHSA1/START domain
MPSTIDIVQSVDIDSTPQRLYEAITTQEGLAAWWTPQVKARPRVGAINEFTFGRLTTLSFRVERLKRGRFADWAAVQVPPEWEGTCITFDITQNEGSVTLRFSHTGLPPTYTEFGTFSYLWAQYLRSLKLYLETGQGEPFGSAGSLAAGATPRRAMMPAE